MKTLNQMLDGYKPKAGDEQKFKDKHVVVKSKLSKPTEDDQVFNATNVKTIKREPHHGYDQGKDEEVYEAAEQTPPFVPSKSTFKKAKNPNRTPMDSVKALAQKGMKTKTNEEVVAEERSEEAYSHYKKHVLPIYKKHGLSPEFAKAVNNHVAKHGSWQVYNHHGDADGRDPHWFDSEKQKVKPIKQKRGYEVSEEVVAEADKHSFVGKILRGHELKKKVDSTWKDIGNAQKAGDKEAGSKAFRKHVRYVNLERPGTWTKSKDKGVAEEVEQIDEKLTASDSTSTWIHDFVHSKNKKFAGKSKEERIKMALGAKYAKEDFDFSEEELVLLESSDGAKNLYTQNHKDSLAMLKQVGEAIKQHKTNAMMGNTHYGHVGTMKNIKRQLEDLHQQITQENEYGRPMKVMEEVEEQQQAPLFQRVTSLSKLLETSYKKQPVGVKIHYTHPEKKATWAQHFSASDAASGEKEMAAQGYKVKKRELIYGKAGA